MNARVGISGMGVLSPIGHGTEAFTEGLRRGESGVGPIKGFDASRHRVQRAAEVKWERPTESPYSRATAMALAAARESIADSGLSSESLRSVRTGVILASNQGGMPSTVARYRELTSPYRRGRIEHALAARILDGSPTATLDLLMSQFGGTGLSLNVSTACSAGLHAIGIAYESLRRGEADVMLVTGVEVLTEPALAGFSVLRALTVAEGPRPFDRRRDGTILGEGAAAIVMERVEGVRARGAGLWAEICGYGSSTDAFHMTRPVPAGAVRAMRQALGTTNTDEIDWIKTHGTGTPANDLAEAAAIHTVFGVRSNQIPVTSIKPMLGHSLGASGVVESVALVLAMRHGFVPQTLNLDQLDADCDLDVVSGAARVLAARAVLANAFGFGGNNAAVLFKAPTC